MTNPNLRNLKLYPHFKITREKFPRVLATRKVEKDSAEYLGAFLPRTGARILLGFINKIFRLRTCEIDIENGLPIPCEMFYKNRCLAPCVEDICSEDEYSVRVNLLRLFLKNERKELQRTLMNKIEGFSSEFDFESAAKWRDILLEIENFWQGKRSHYWLDKAIDTWEFVEDDRDGLVLNLVTQRGRKILGNRSFLFKQELFGNRDKTIERAFLQFYKIYLPKEIRVLTDFENRRRIAEKLSRRFNKKVPIFVQYEVTPTTRKGLLKNEFDSVIKNLSPKGSYINTLKSIKKIFKLKRIPKVIESYDVAHISGEDVVTARVVWRNGRIESDQKKIWHFEDVNEPQAITRAVMQRFAYQDTSDLSPDLVLIDGGKTQIRAAIKGLKGLKSRTFEIVSAVKPRGKHRRVSHFLNEVQKEITGVDENALQFLTHLRDEAHDLANRTHRSIRDMNFLHDLALLLPDFTEDERRTILKQAGSLYNLKESNLSELRSSFSDEIAQRIYRQVKTNRNTKQKYITSLIPIKFIADGGMAEDLRMIDDR